MMFIAVRCPHCQSDPSVKRGKTARGTQRYVCQHTLGPNIGNNDSPPWR